MVPAKVLGCEWSIEPFSPMGYSRTVGETFYTPECHGLWMREMRNWGRFGMTDYILPSHPRTLQLEQ